jgi:hypothetical protein
MTERGPAVEGDRIELFVGSMSASESVLGGKKSITLYSGASKCASHVGSGT